MTDVLLAAPGLGQEPDLVVAARSAGLRVVRRCVDVADLMAAAAADPGAVAIVSAGLPRLSADAVERLAAAVRVIGLAEDDAAAERLRRLGIDPVVRAAASAAETAQALHEAGSAAGTGAAAGVWSTGCWAEPGEESVPSASPGLLVAVWGPMGAPGRTTVAIGLAEVLAEEGRRVCLVDADTYAPSVALALGLVEDVSGLVVACRHADNGSLTSAALSTAVRRVRADWHVLGGIPSPDRWAELRPGALDRVWAACRAAFDVTVIDVGFCLEDDEAGAWSRRRNAAALTALAAADHVIAVADAAGSGAARLAAAWPAFSAAAPGTPMTVVRNRARDAGRPWVRAMRSCGVRAEVHAVPSDPRALAGCWEQGRTLGEGARRSRVRGALRELAHRAVSG